MKIKTIVGTLLLAGLATVAQAQKVSTTLTSAPGMVKIKGELTITATVVKVDAKTRIVTLKAANGEVEEIFAGPEVRNFDQIKAGDAVHGKATQSLTLELIKGGAGEPRWVEGSGQARAEKGTKPSGAMAENASVIASVVAVDRANRFITVKGPLRTLILDVNDPEQLKLIEVGDSIKATFRVAVAVALASAPSK